ncbi:MAG: type II secretion system protein [Christensenellaceae bacterium]
MNSRKRRKGFTLVELSIVLVIVAILSVSVASLSVTINRRVKINEAQNTLLADLNFIETAVKDFFGELDADTYLNGDNKPSGLQDTAPFAVKNVAEENNIHGQRLGYKTSAEQAEFAYSIEIADRTIRYTTPGAEGAISHALPLSNSSYGLNYMFFNTVTEYAYTTGGGTQIYTEYTLKRLIRCEVNYEIPRIDSAVEAKYGKYYFTVTLETETMVDSLLA